jgi:GDP-4-dehydro-6-deoxy-D-mannose reductase
MKKILITGAGGFVGSYLIKELQKNPDNDIYGAVYRSTSDLSALLRADHLIAGDLTDFTYTKQLIQTTKPALIYHLAALSAVHNSTQQVVKVINTNTTISYHTLEAIRLFAPSARLVAICSANVYGAVQNTDKPISESTAFRPLNPYAVSKVTQEMLALQYHLAHNLDTIILRPFNHTGVGQTTDFVIPALAKQFAAIAGGAEPVLSVGNIDNTRDFTDVSDMAKAYVLAAEKCQSGEVYNIGSGVGYTVRAIIGIFEKLIGQKVELKSSPEQVRSSDVPVLIADATKFCSATGWKPTVSLENTISAILNSYRSIS